YPNINSTHVVELTPDGNTVVFNSRTQVIVADVESGKILQSLDRGVGDPLLSVNHVAVDDDASTVLAGHEDGRLCLWNVASGDLVTCVSGGTLYTETQNQIRYLPTNRYATVRVTASVSVQYIDALTGDRSNSLNMVPGVLMDISPDGGKVLVSRDIRDAGTGTLLLSLEDPGKAEIHNLSYRFSRDGSRVIGASDTILVWDAATGELLVEQPSPLTAPGSWDSDGSVLVLGGGQDDPIVVADVDTLATLYTIPAGDGFAAGWISISADGSRFGVAQGYRTRVYDTADGSLVQEFIHGAGARYSADLSTNVSVAHRWNGEDSVFSDAYPRDVLVVRHQGQEPLLIPTEADHDITSLGISNDGSLLASWEEDFVVVRDAATGTPVDSTLFGPPSISNVPRLDFSPDNRYLRYQLNGRTMLFDLQDDMTRVFNEVYETAFLPGSPTRMLRASGNAVEIFQVETLTAGDAVTMPGDINVLASSIAAERFLVALSGEGGTAVYDAMNGSLLQDFAALAGEG
ncbi:MAG: hypothetical protein RLZZ303_777, partial [Candidatus Hydrogenedentota bacterium]